MTDWNDIPGIIQFDVVLIHAMLVGQTIFLGLWSTLRWWKEWVGRSLMVKSVALWLLIAAALVNFYITILGDVEWMHWEEVMIFTHVAVVVGIWSQVGAIGHEMLLARRGPGKMRNAQKDKIA